MAQNEIMTVAGFRQLLQESSNEIIDDFQIWLSSDEEGNEFLPMLRNPELCLAIEPAHKRIILYLLINKYSEDTFMIYIRLFHGRTDPNQEMDDWGTDGPILGPYEFAHTTYAWHIKLGKPDGGCDELFVYEDMLYYNGVYYGDWTIFDGNCLRDGKYELTPFEQQKAVLPK